MRSSKVDLNKKEDSKYFVIRNAGTDDVPDIDENREEVKDLRMGTSSSHSSKRNPPTGLRPNLNSSSRNIASREQLAVQETPKSTDQKMRQTSSQLQSRNSMRDPAASTGSRFDLRDSNPQLLGEGRISEYGEEEENIICARFLHLSFCACEIDCNISIKEIELLEVYPGIFLGGFTHGLGIRKLLQKGVTHILNVTAQEYKKRKYFTYMNIDVYNKSDEDIKKHFRITNRFIKDCLQAGGKILIQDMDGTNIGPCFALAYFINNEKIPLKIGLERLQELTNLQIGPNFVKQLERYDLEKLALVTIKKKN